MRPLPQACAYLGVSKSTLWRIIRRGDLRPIRYNKGASNGIMVFSRADLDAYIAAS